MFDLDFPKADPVPRGCGEREPGGVYAESGLSPRGRPLEEFLFDPPLPIPEGLDLINKPQLWQRMLASGEPALDENDLPIFDLLIWVGEEHYPYCCDMILAHPHVLNMQWQEQRPPLDCKKAVPGHDAALAASDDEVEGATSEAEEEMSLSAFAYRAGDHAGAPLPALPLEALRTGPCLFKLWELIPREAAQTVIDVAEEEAGERHPGTAPLPLCLREIGSTIYQYRPTGESADGLVPGLFAALPITGFALIRYHDGSVDDRAKAKILAGLEAHESHALPFYETDR